MTNLSVMPTASFALERSTKLILNFALGRRSKATTDIFIEGLRQAASSQNFQITTDGFAPYFKLKPSPTRLLTA